MAAKAAAKQNSVANLVDKELEVHLRKAEDHLIQAVKLFERKHHPDRSKDFVARLTRAQELVTWLFREELVRIRGPIKMTATIKRKK